MTQVAVPPLVRDTEDRPKNAKPHEHTPTCGECGDVLEDFVLMGDDGRPSRSGWRKIGELFRKELPTKDRPGRGMAKFRYITARQVAERLDGIVGPANWQTCFRVLDADKVVVECTLSIYSVSKCDVGYSNNPDADHESEPFKAAYSDAFKRAAVQWGIGRFLYDNT